MEAVPELETDSARETVGKIDLGHGKLLIPDMNRATTRLLAAALRSFEIDAHVLPTYKGIDLGKKFTSGKECFPCLVDAHSR